MNLEEVLGKLATTLETINGRLEKLEKAKALEIDPEKLKASTADPSKLPALRVIEPAKDAKSGVPGGQLEEPWPDPRTTRPPIQR